MAIKSVLIDLSGTLHVENSVITGAVEALARLRASELNVCFVTNTTKESKKSLFNRLISIGFDIKEKEIFSSLTSARQLVENKNLRPLLLLENDALQDFSGIDCCNPNAVVVGLAPNKFDYSALNKALKLLLNNSTFIAVHKGKYYKRSDGLSLGPGAFVSALEYASGVEAEVVGKPEPLFFQSCLEKIGSNPTEAVMIGDDIKDDINGAQKIGIKGILVKTGKYREGDENKIFPPPSFISNTFTEAVHHLLADL